MRLEQVLACVDEETELPISTEEERLDCEAVLAELRSMSDEDVISTLRVIIRLTKASVRARIEERWAE